MKISGRHNILFSPAAVLGLLLLSMQACAHSPSVRTESVKAGGISGTYTVIFYGGNYLGDLETIAFLDKEEDGYSFEPYAPDFAYEVIKGLGAKQALEKAELFIRTHASYKTDRLMGIHDNQGNVIGYELRPLYSPVAFGTDDVLDVNYSLKGEVVLISVRLKHDIEKMKSEGVRIITPIRLPGNK